MACSKIDNFVLAIQPILSHETTKKWKLVNQFLSKYRLDVKLVVTTIFETTLLWDGMYQSYLSISYPRIWWWYNEQCPYYDKSRPNVFMTKMCMFQRNTIKYLQEICLRHWILGTGITCSDSNYGPGNQDIIICCGVQFPAERWVHFTGISQIKSIYQSKTTYAAISSAGINVVSLNSVAWKCISVLFV